MRTIGVLGGMSWESTARYYRLLNELVRDRLGGLHSARCLIYSVDFADIERLQVADRWDEAGTALAEAAMALEKAGADVILIGTNTMHIVADQVRAAVSVPVLNIIDVTAAAVAAAGLSQVGLLGTSFTMERSFYTDRLLSNGIRAIVPPADQRAIVHQVIYDELCRGVVRDESRDQFRAIIGDLVSAGAEGVILGCTEIELLIGAADSPVPVFPTTALHVAAAVDHALSSA